MAKRAQQKKQPTVAGGIFLIILGFIFLGVMAAYLISSSDYLLHGPKDLNQMLETEGEPVYGEYVKVDVDAIVDWYAETEYRINGIIPAGKKKHAVIWLDNDAMMGITVKSKNDLAEVDRIINGTWAWMLGNSEEFPKAMTVEGKIAHIGSEVSKYYSDAKGYVRTSLGDYTFYDLEIDVTDNKSTIIMYNALILLIAVCMFACGISNIKKAKQLKLQAQTVVVANDDPFATSMDNQTTSNDDMNL